MTETFDPEQTGNAALIAALSIKRDLPPRAATIALTTAYQESKIRNLAMATVTRSGSSSSDRARAGAPTEQILDPVYSTNKFYDALVKVQGYETADITKIAQKVQRSGYPEAYRDHEGQGRVLASTLTGHSPAGLTCRARGGDAARVTRHGRGRPRHADGHHARPRPGEGPDRHCARPAARPGRWATGPPRAPRTSGSTAVAVGERAWDRADRDGAWTDGAASPTVTITLQ